MLFYDTTGVAGDNDLYWDNTNKRLGIGTITPSASLHVNPSSGGNGEVNVERTSGTIINLQAQSALGVIGTNSNHDLAFKTNGNAYVRLKTNGNVGIGTASPSEKLEVVGNIKVGDSQKFIAGDSGDLQIYHNGSDSYIDNITNHLVIQNQSANKDIIFKSDDGSGGLATYFQLDGGDELTLFSKNVKLSDSVELRLGNSNDLVIKHNATNSVVDNTTGNLVIQNQANDADIIFKSDDGSGGTAEYFRLDGSAAITVASKEFRFADSVPLKFGNLPDVEIIHNGTNTLISNETGDLYITNAQNDGDILFRW